MPFAIITGATQGIGKAIAELLLAEGFSIAVCSRSRENIDKVKKEWTMKYPSAGIIAMAGDLSVQSDVAAFANLVLKEFPCIDILINNAGMFLPGNLADEPDGLLEKMIGINLYSAYHLTRKILPAMVAKKTGHIFNMCSIASLKAYDQGGSYSISKYALLGFSENLREELKPSGIKVTALCPGATYTPSWEGSGISPERIMEANDVARMLWAAYCLSASANVETIVMRPVKGDL